MQHRVLLAALLGFIPILSAADETADEAKAEMAARVEAWKERLREEPERQAEYWARRVLEDAASRAKAQDEMAQLKERAKGLTAASTPAAVEQALGKVGAELISVRGKERSKTWTYLYHADDDSYLSFDVEFAADNTCKVRAVERTREEAASEAKHVMVGTFERIYPGYPSDERCGFLCKDASIDGKPVGKVPFIIADDRPRAAIGRMGEGAKVTIIYHGKPDDFVFLGQRALSLESMSFTGLPEPTPEEEAAKELERKREYEREQAQQPAAPRTKLDYVFPPAAQRTVDLLKKEIVPLVDYKDADATLVFEDIRQRMEKLGVTHRYVVRFPQPASPETEELSLGKPDPPALTEPAKVSELRLRNVPLFELMSYFGDSAGWG